MLVLWKKSYDKPRQHIKNQRSYFANEGLSSLGCGFSSSHVRMWETNHKESWALKNWCFWTVVLKKTLESPLDCKEIQRDQLWIFIRRTAKAEAPILWPHDTKNWLTEKKTLSNRDWDSWMISPTPWTWVWASSSSWWWTGKSGLLQRGSHEVSKSQTRLSNWTERNWTKMMPSRFLLDKITLFKKKINILLESQDQWGETTGEVLSEA